MTIDRSELEKRLARIRDIFVDISQHAEKQMQLRCPYKNVQCQCTAKFGCRYQRKPTVGGAPLLCSHDDQFDFRSAWESDPENLEKMRHQLRDIRKNRY